MEFEHKFGYHTEVAASTPDAPEKIRIFGITCGQYGAICGNNSGLFRQRVLAANCGMMKNIAYLGEIVDCEPMRSAQPSEATSEGKTELLK
jgi:hypothetical protein